MVLEVVYVVRHGYRSNWSVDPSTGHYDSNIPSPTGIVADPALASYGVAQAKQLGKHLISLSPPVDKIYSSPFYRCIQTLQPFTTELSKIDPKKATINLERGVGEFYGQARFDHPSPATIEVLNEHFPNLQQDREAIIVPSTKGESIPQLHDRVAYCLSHLIAEADADPNGPKAVLICSHAAAMIAIGRVLTGNMPEDDTAEDFNCFTASFSKFVRRGKAQENPDFSAVKGSWDPAVAEKVPDVKWRGGAGVGGGWECEVNGDCSFLDGGEERGWHFTGDESFLDDPNGYGYVAPNYETESKMTPLSQGAGKENKDRNQNSRL